MKEKEVSMAKTEGRKKKNVKLRVPKKQENQIPSKVENPTNKSKISGEELDMKGYFEAKKILTPILRIITKITIEGTENIPKEGPYVLIANHKSDLDPLAAKYMFNVPIIGEFFRRVNCIPISKEKEDIEAAFKKSEEVLNSGNIIGIFPEGWDYIADGRFNKPTGKFHTGFARVALAAGVSVLPVAVIPLESFVDKMPFPKWMREIWKWPEKMQLALNRLAYKRVHIKIGKLVHFNKEPKPSYEKLTLICTKMQNTIDKMIREHEAHILIDD